MVQPTLDERFRGSPPTRGRQDKRGWVTDEERRFMLWGLKERWPAAKIGRALGVNEATVRRFKRQISDDPLTVLDLGLLETTGISPDDGSYRCLICGNVMRGRDRIERHLLDHFFEEDVVDGVLPDEQAGYQAAALESIPEADEVDQEPEVEPETLQEIAEPVAEQLSEPLSEGPHIEDDRPPMPDEPETSLSEEPKEDFPSSEAVDADEDAREDETSVLDQQEPDEETGFSPIESMLDAALRRINDRSLELEQIDIDDSPPGTEESREVEMETSAELVEELPYPTREEVAEDKEPEVDDVDTPIAPTEAATEIEVKIVDVDKVESEGTPPVAFELDEDDVEPEEASPAAVESDEYEESSPTEQASESAPERTEAQEELERLMGEPVVFAPLEELDENDPEVESYRDAFKKLAARRGALERSADTPDQEPPAIVPTPPAVEPDDAEDEDFEFELVTGDSEGGDDWEDEL